MRNIVENNIREILKDEEERNLRREQIYDIDVLLDSTIRRAEEGLRQIIALESEFLSEDSLSWLKRHDYNDDSLYLSHPDNKLTESNSLKKTDLNSNPPTKNRLDHNPVDENSDFDEDQLIDLLSASPVATQTTYTRRAVIKQNSDIDSVCDHSFGSSEDFESTSRLPKLDQPIPPSRRNPKRMNSSSSSSFTDSAFGSSFGTPVSPLNAQKEFLELHRQNSGLHRQISDMQLDMHQLQKDIKHARQSVTSLKPKKLDLPRDLPADGLTLVLKNGVDNEKARKSMDRLQMEIQNIFFEPLLRQ